MTIVDRSRLKKWKGQKKKKKINAKNLSFTNLSNFLFANNNNFSKMLSILEYQQDISSLDFYFYDFGAWDFFEVAFT